MDSQRSDMPLRRVLTIAMMLALGLPAIFSLLPGCESTPSEPVYENPFDPDGPDDGDPLQARAEATNDTTITVSWNQPQNMGILRYVISRSANPDSDWEELGPTEHTGNPTGSYPYNRPDPTSTHWFRVQAFTATEYSITSYATAGSTTAGPRVIVGQGTGTTATRFVNLEITVTQGEQLRIALDPTFTDSLRVIPTGSPNEPINLTYDLGPASDNNEIRTLHVVSFSDGYESVPSVQNVRVDFKPGFKIVGEPKTLATRTVDLTIPTEGVINMRFFAEWTDTTTTPWVPVSDTYAGYQLDDSANPQFIRGQFQGDFGFNTFVEITATPDLLTTATFRLDLPDSVNHTTDQSTVWGISSAVATEMRYSETPDFTSSPWMSYADSVLITLSPTPGHKVIHVQYRNDYTQSGVLTDYVNHVTLPAEVSIWSPRDGDILLGGSVFQVRGGSTVGAGTGSVYLVQFDGGDGTGFVNVTGTDAWSYLWNVPRFTNDTPLTIRAQAFYGPSPDSLESVITDLTVTVTQLAVAITAPADGAELVGNKKVNFTGTAVGVLGGAALDSVNVHIGADYLPASGEGNWSLEWTAPLWQADTTLTVTAVVLDKDGETATTSIEVNVVRPAIAITTPADGDLVDGDFDLDIAGITFADLFAAPVDSVVLDLEWGSETAHLPTAGTGTWSASWRTPVVEANTLARIIAVAHANTESKADTVAVTIKP